MKEVIIFLSLAIATQSSAFSQNLAGFVVHFEYSTPNVPSPSSSATNDAYEQIEQQIYAKWAADIAENHRDIGRFERKLLMSSDVVNRMDGNKKIASKYPRIYALYNKSFESFKKLEVVSAQAKAAVNAGKSISGFQAQEDQIAEVGLNEYHKAEILQELGDRKKELIEEEKNTFLLENCLSPEEKKELDQLKTKIKNAQKQISKLHASRQSAVAISQSLNNNYYVIAQSTKSLAKITEKTLVLFAPNEKLGQIVNVSQKVFDNWVDEAIANGRPPTEALEKALKEGYKQYKHEQQTLKKTPDGQRIERIKDIFKQMQTEYVSWEKIDKNRVEVFKKVNETIAFTDDLIAINQKIVNEAAAKGDALLSRRIDGGLKSKLP